MNKQMPNIKGSNELLLKYLLRLKDKDFLSRTELNYSLSKTYPETERTRVLRNAIIKRLINEKVSLKTYKVGRSTTLYSISEQGMAYLHNNLGEAAIKGKL